MHKGSCLCGAVSFELNCELKSSTHCHCKMCQKQHGAAFATYASVPINNLHYVSGLAQLTVYKSSSNIERKFCSICGSNIEWRGSKNYPDWVSIAVGTLDTPFMPKSIKQIHTQSKVCWLENN